MIANVIVAVILTLLVVGIVAYLIRAKRRGQTCIGCPHAKQCGSACCGSCGGSGSHDAQVHKTDR